MQNAKLSLNSPLSTLNPFLESSSEFLDHNRLPRGEVAGNNMLASLTHQPEVKAYVVQRCNLCCQHLATHHEVVEIGLRVGVVYEGGAIRVDWREVVLPLLVAYVYNALACE